LATKQNASNGPDWRDVAGNIVAFEAMSGVRVEIRLSTTDYRGRADIAITALAHQVGKEIGEALPLASVSVRCSGTKLRTVDAALIHALYLLDGQLGWQELVGENNQEA